MILNSPIETLFKKDWNKERWSMPARPAGPNPHVQHFKKNLCIEHEATHVFDGCMEQPQVWLLSQLLH